MQNGWIKLIKYCLNCFKQELHNYFWKTWSEDVRASAYLWSQTFYDQLFYWFPYVKKLQAQSVSTEKLCKNNLVQKSGF